MQEKVQLIEDYEQIKDKLQIRVCETAINRDRIAGLVHSERSDFSATYHIVFDKEISFAVKPGMLKAWEISKEQLHQDALTADLNRIPVLEDVRLMLERVRLEKEPINLLQKPDFIKELEGFRMYCLTNEEYDNGAGLIMQDGLISQVADILGSNYYIVPSSINELLIIPDSKEVELNILASMVWEVNRIQVAPEARLSDEVQYYDKDSRSLENAQKHAERIEMEKYEKETAKEMPRSIHDRLKDNKQNLKISQKKMTANEVTKQKEFSI